MKGLDTEIHDTAADVEANVQSKEEESVQGAPMDPQFSVSNVWGMDIELERYSDTDVTLNLAMVQNSKTWC